MIGTEFLQSHALFGGLTDTQLGEIRPMLQGCGFMPGDLIIKEGEEGDRLFFICDGEVEILKRQDESNEVLVRLSTLGVGDTFGEMELLDIQPRCATVKALTEVHTLVLTGHDLYELYHRDIEAYTLIILNLARELSRRLRHSDALVASSLFGEHTTG